MGVKAELDSVNRYYEMRGETNEPRFSVEIVHRAYKSLSALLKPQPMPQDMIPPKISDDLPTLICDS